MKTTTVTRALAATGIAAAAILTPLTAGVASASAPAPAAPAPTASASAAADGPVVSSSCRPANYRGTVAPDAASAGHHHYRVTLVAAPGTSPCTLAGSPADVGFDRAGTPLAVSATPYGDQTVPVAFGPGSPVHFDIQVPNSDGPATAGTVSFTLQTSGSGQIPGRGFAGGYMEVDAGTAIGPVQPGV